MLNLDISLFFISAIVGILMIVLNRLYLKPIGQVLEERETKIERESNQIETMSREIDEKTQHYEKVLKDTQLEARKIKEELIKKGEEVRDQIITDARENSKTMFDAKMKQLDDEISTAEKKLEKQISAFSDKIKDIFL